MLGRLATARVELAFLLVIRVLALASDLMFLGTVLV
jgi:hypothetical protein